MFNKSLISKNKRDIIIFDYAHNYGVRDRKRKWKTVLKIAKWAVVGCMFAMSLLYMNKLQAAGYNKFATLDDVASGQLLFESSERIKTNRTEKRLFQPAVLLNSSAEFDINGIIATVTVTQSFLNNGDTIANGLYTFPLPENSAVNYLNIQMGNKTIEGKILEKQAAKKLFNQAKQQGKKASLVEQLRPNLFTNSIANIAPKEQVTVTIKYVQHVDYNKGLFSLRFPMKITPRYSPKNNVLLSNTKTTPNDLHSNEERTSAPTAKITPPLFGITDNFVVSYLTELASLQTNNIQLNVNLNAGVPLDAITSSSHKLTTTKSRNSNNYNNERYQVSVGNVQVPMDRDFILQWRPKASATPQLSVVSQMLDGESYALAMLIPPTATHLNDNNMSDTHFARDVTFIIDTSGSMQGASIKQAKQSLRFALNTLTEQDSFNIIAFESTATNLFSTTMMATPNIINKALSFIGSLSADGGTEMYKPLSSALTMSQAVNQNSNAIKQILFITDGAVSNEKALFKLINDAYELPRLFTVGIGSAPNGYFMRKAAQFGQGSYTYIGNTNEVEEKMSNLLRKISRPALRNIKVQFTPLHTGTLEQFPKRIPDLYTDEPLIVAFKTAIMPTGIQLFGELSNKPWQNKVSLSSIDSNSPSVTHHKQQNGITSIWARAKIEDLLDGLITGKTLMEIKPKVISTSIKHQVMSPYTSFIAVEKEMIAEPELALEELEADSLVDNNRGSIKKKAQRLARSNKTAHLTKMQSMNATPFPTTAVGWLGQLIFGVLLLMLSGIAFLLTRKATLTNRSQHASHH